MTLNKLVKEKEEEGEILEFLKKRPISVGFVQEPRGDTADYTILPMVKTEKEKLYSTVSYLSVGELDNLRSRDWVQDYEEPTEQVYFKAPIEFVFCLESIGSLQEGLRRVLSRSSS